MHIALLIGRQFLQTPKDGVRLGVVLSLVVTGDVFHSFGQISNQFHVACRGGSRIGQVDGIRCLTIQVSQRWALHGNLQYRCCDVNRSYIFGEQIAFTTNGQSILVGAGLGTVKDQGQSARFLRPQHSNLVL